MVSKHSSSREGKGRGWVIMVMVWSGVLLVGEEEEGGGTLGELPWNYKCIYYRPKCAMSKGEVERQK